MKKDDEFPLKNEEYDDDAQAVNESELLPIFEAMNFSGDMQVLEDIEAPEIVTVAFQQKKKSELKNSDKRDLKKKKIPFISGLNKKTKIAVLSVLAFLIVCGAVFGVLTAVRGKADIKPLTAIYSSDKTTFIDVGTEKKYQLSDVQDLKVSADGTRVYYSTGTSSRTGKFDIRFINTEKISSLKKGGKNICAGVDEDWSVNADGHFLCYSITKNSEKICYIFDAETGKSEEVATEFEEFFLPPQGDTVYFTRRNGSIYSLHRKRFGEASENVASKISYVKFCATEKDHEVLYTVETGENAKVDVYSVKNYDTPAKICDGASEVYLNDYVCGGNLYYFKKNSSHVDWQDFVQDNYFESDMKLSKPEESDYMTEYGFFIKRYILDKNAYDTAKQKYNAKLQRDEIRAELDKIDFGLASGETYSCYVYNNVSNKLLANGVALKNIMAFAVKDTPRIVFSKSVISVDNKISMSELVDIAESEGVANAGDYAREQVEYSYEMSDECIYAMFDGSRVMQYGVQGYKSKNATFLLSSAKNLYVLQNGKLYFNEISSKGIGKNTLAASGVYECEVNGSFVYYLKKTDKENSALFRYSKDSGEEKLGDKIYSFVVTQSGKVLAFSENNEQSDRVSLSVFDGTKLVKTDKDISLNHLIYNDSSVAYIKNIGGSDITNAGDMYICTLGDTPKKVSSDITDIRYIRDNSSDGNIPEK